MLKYLVGKFQTYGPIGTPGGKRRDERASGLKPAMREGHQPRPGALEEEVCVETPTTRGHEAAHVAGGRKGKGGSACAETPRLGRVC